MALKGKLIGYVEISSDIEEFHGLWIHKGHHLASILPHTIHACELLSGQRGVAGSVVQWEYTQEGKRKFVKQIIESVDNMNHTSVYKCVGGELAEVYKSFTISFHNEVKDGKQLVAWIFDFERENTSVPYPTSVMDYVCDLFQQLDAHLSCK
ncbi:MLP-like protein 43 [Rutidosis leptorrhynchoides]|uniref:MLP-like protein 43 n=1 Tax=Rutidosis leptorrhynchoides TaxID=125765 RepID=UPI003A9A22CA